MGVTTREILRAGLLVCGKLPDIYWDINGISGNELKVLHHLYNTCILLEKHNSKCRRTSEGCPIIYTPKEQLAEKCNMTELTFRTCVKKLIKYGVVETATDVYSNCVGLAMSSKYVNKAIETSEITNSRTNDVNFYRFIIRALYNHILVNTMNIVNIGSIGSIVNINNNVNSKEDTSKASVQSQSSIQDNPETKIIKRVPIISDEHEPVIKRVPIISDKTEIKRVPIISDKTNKLNIYKEKLESMSSTKSCSETGIINIARYYEYKCRIANNSTGFRALPVNNPENHKNWIHFSRVYELCLTNDIDYEVYLDAQFDRVKYWKHGNKYPFVNQLYSEAALKYYYSYEKETKQKMGASKNYKLKAKKMKTVRQEIIDCIINDCEQIAYHLDHMSDRIKNKVTPSQEKSIYILDNWMSLSAYYVSTIPWFKDVLDMAPSEDVVIQEYKEKYNAVTKNKKLMSLTKQIVDTIEKHYKLPETFVV